MNVRDTILATPAVDTPDFESMTDMNDFMSDDPNWSLDYYFYLEEKYANFYEGRMIAEPDQEQTKS